MNVKKCVILIVLASLISGCTATLGRWPSGVTPAEFHAKALASGDWRYYQFQDNAVGSVPYHWLRLVELGEASLPVLLRMLADDTPTPFIWNSGVVSFDGNYLLIIKKNDPDPVERRATVSELADLALQRICKCRGVGFSSDLPVKERDQAVERWRKIVRERTESSQSEDLSQEGAASESSGTRKESDAPSE